MNDCRKEEMNAFLLKAGWNQEKLDFTPSPFEAGVRCSSLPCPALPLQQSRCCKRRRAGQSREEAGSCPDGKKETTYFSFSESGELPNNTCTETLIECQRGVMLSYPQASVEESILAKTCVHTRGSTKYGL